MRVRSRRDAAIFGAVFAVFVAACGFGVNLDNLFADGTTTNLGDGAVADSAQVDAPPFSVDATIPTVKVVQIALGQDYGCGRRIDGTVMCWGYNDSYGQLGYGGALSSSTPVLVKDISDAADLVAGPDHACVVHATGAVSCWGNNESRQLGDGSQTSTSTPVSVVQITNATHVSAGYDFSCALLKDGTVSCWGDDSNGQLGDGMTTQRSQPAPVQGISGATQIASAGDTSCALTGAGAVYCWGGNGNGETGNANPPNTEGTATKVAGLSGITALTSSGTADHFCALTATSTIMCWGNGNSGQLGNGGSNSYNPTPVTVATISDAIGISGGGGVSCSWNKAGTANCWGSDDWRELGAGDVAPPGSATTPLPVVQLTGVMQVANGDDFGCALLNGGENISCWGGNYSGSLGRGTRVFSAVPVKTVLAGASASIAAGGSQACAVDKSGGLSCWGFNDIAQLGTSSINGSGTPLTVANISGVTQAAAGGNHTCELTGAQVKCWGHGEYGPLGDGNESYYQPNPVVFGVGNVTRVGAGNDFTCALLSDGQVWCSGGNNVNQQGRGGGQNDSPQPVLSSLTAPDAGGAVDSGVEGGVVDSGPPPGPPSYTGVSNVWSASAHSCLVHGGTLACWGSSQYGESGIQTYAFAIPHDIALPSAPLDVGIGGGHTCVVITDGSVRCFGNNSNGQLGTGGGGGTSLQTPSLGGKAAKAITAGNSHTCALISDGTVMCWGAGGIGQIGNNVLSDTPTPTAVTGLANVTAISARSNYTCALESDGSVWCWGDNQQGTLGDGVILSTGTPGAVVGY